MTTYAELNIAEIPYESGSIRFRYARVMAPDGTRWIRHGLFVAYYEAGSVVSEGQYIDGKRTAFAEISIRAVDLQRKAAIKRVERLACGDTGILTARKSRAPTMADVGQKRTFLREVHVLA